MPGTYHHREVSTLVPRFVQIVEFSAVPALTRSKYVSRMGGSYRVHARSLAEPLIFGLNFFRTKTSAAAWFLALDDIFSPFCPFDGTSARSIITLGPLAHSCLSFCSSGSCIKCRKGLRRLHTGPTRIRPSGSPNALPHDHLLAWR